MGTKSYTKKQLHKVLSVNKKENGVSLAGACRSYAANISKQNLQKICKDLKVPLQIATDIYEAAKKHDGIMNIVRQMIPMIDNTYIEFRTYKKTYKDKKNESLNVSPSENLQKKVIVGSNFKEFGHKNPIKQNSVGAWYITIDKGDYIETKVAIKKETYNTSFVDKCIEEYLSKDLAK